MKYIIPKFLLMITVLLVFGHISAKAQIDSDAMFKVNVPFPFEVREKKFPAGEYVIQTPDSSTDDIGTLEISTAKGKKMEAVFTTVPISVDHAPTEPNIVFGKVRGRYFLSEIWQADNANGAQVEERNMKVLEKGGIKEERQVVRAEMSHKEKRTPKTHKKNH